MLYQARRTYRSTEEDRLTVCSGTRVASHWGVGTPTPLSLTHTLMRAHSLLLLTFWPHVFISIIHMRWRLYIYPCKTYACHAIYRGGCFFRNLFILQLFVKIIWIGKLNCCTKWLIYYVTEILFYWLYVLTHTLVMQPCCARGLYIMRVLHLELM